MNNNIEHAKDLSQYFTASDDAIWCCNELKNILKRYKIKYSDRIFLESAAGGGSFVDAFKKVFGNKPIEAYDIEPQREDIIYKDFLNDNVENKNYISIGNPPFGKRGKLAIDFVNKSAEVGNIIGFIVPIQFTKYSIQSKLNKNLRLIYSEVVPGNDYDVCGTSYHINCVFQIWTTLSFGKDIRIRERPKTECNDFEMFLYNNTKTALKFFDKEKYNWNFAVPRQGYYDYSLRITDEKELNPKVQYMFFKTNSDIVLKRLYQIDYGKLATNNTTTPGYGKADIVKEYCMLYGCN